MLPIEAIRRKPSNLNFAEAAVFSISYSTAWHALVDRGNLQAGETLLVLGAAGATGYAAVQIGKYLGAHAIASASSEAKQALAWSGGADQVVKAYSQSWRNEVRTANSGRNIDVVFDPIGGNTTELAFRTLGWKGRHLIIGFPAGIASLPTNLPLLKGSSLVGVDVRQFDIFEPTKCQANLDMIFGLADKGILRPHIGFEYPLENYQAAMEHAATGRAVGRIILTTS